MISGNTDSFCSSPPFACTEEQVGAVQLGGWVLQYLPTEDTLASRLLALVVLCRYPTVLVPR